MNCISIHLTDLCNSACKFCVVASPLYTEDSINYAEVVDFLKSHADTEHTIVNLHGGEPTIHPRFLETLELIRDLGYREVHLQTNGIRLADRGFVGKLVQVGVRKFIISLHGDRAEIQDSQTCSPGGFAKTINGIQNAKHYGALVRTNTVISSANIDSLLHISELACSLGVDHLNFSNLHPVGSAAYSRSQIMMQFENIRHPLYKAVDFALSAGRQVTLEGFPYCVVRERAKYQLNNEYRGIRMLMRGKIIEDYDRFMSDVMRVFGPPCETCGAHAKCGGVYPQYIEYFGWSEFFPIEPEANWRDELKDFSQETNDLALSTFSGLSN